MFAFLFPQSMFIRIENIIRSILSQPIFFRSKRNENFNIVWWKRNSSNATHVLKGKLLGFRLRGVIEKILDRNCGRGMVLRGNETREIRGLNSSRLAIGTNGWNGPRW